MIKRILLIGAGLALVAAAPPTNVPMSNGTTRAVTPVAVVDGNGDQIVTFGGGSGGSGGAVTAASGSYAAGSIVDLGTGASPAANTVNARLSSLLTALGAPLQAGGTVVLGSTSQTNIAYSGTVGIGLADNADATAVSATANGLKVAGRGYVYNGTSWDRQRGTTEGTNTLPTPSASSAVGITPATVQAASANPLKTTAGNVYALNVVNSTTAGFVVVYDSATTPSNAAALTASLVRYCMPLAASAGLRDRLDPPIAVTAGAQLLFSTNCTTYTATSPVPVQLTGQVK